MENSITNPLIKYFRQPAIYLRLPSEGRYWPEGSLELPLNNEIPVFPLTTKDEIILRTPDALLNGSGVVEVIQSCCPNIKDAWQTPSVDVDAILIAIRIASFGDKMDSETKCPHCSELNEHEVQLAGMLTSIVCPTYSKINVPSLPDLQVKLKPQAFFGANQESSIDYAEQKIRQALEQPDIDTDVRNAEIAKSIQRLIEISINTMVNSTEYIEMPSGEIVSSREHILDFYQNADRAVINELQSVLAKINQEGGLEPIIVPCGSCKKEYSVPLVFDYSNFFVDGS
jgi:hypothetical protein